jgi:hypothetical protein
LVLAIVSEGFRLGGLQVLHLLNFSVNMGTLRAPIHEALLIAENWLEVLVLIYIMNLKTCSQEVGLDLFQVFTLTQSHFDSANSSAHVLDRIAFDNGFYNMLSLSNLSKMGVLGILWESCNHQIEHMTVRLLGILALRILFKRAILIQHIACKILNLKSL